MKLIKHMIFIDVNEEMKLMINSLNGTMDEITLPAFKTIFEWQSCDEIIPSNDMETKLYNNLKNRGYLVNSDEEEVAKKNKTLDSLRKQQADDRKQCSFLTFVITYDCNFRCPYCFEGEANVKKAVMTPEMIDAALGLSGDSLEKILLFGGEPLLPKTRPALKYLISKIPDKTYDIITNGYYVEEFIDLLATIKIGYLMVTLDGEEEHHNSKRFLSNNKPTFQKIINGVEKCLENGITTRIRMNIPEDNIEMSQRLQNNLIERFANYKDLLSFEMSPMLGYSDKQKNVIVSKMFCASLEYNYAERMRRNRALGSMSPIVNAFTTGIPMHPLYSFCYAHKNTLIVDPYGNVYTCLVTVGRDGMEAGKYYPAVSFKENTIHNRNIDKIPECRECTYSLLCGGGCPIRLKDYSDYFKPVCASIKSQIHDLLPKLYLAEKEHKEKLKAMA
ncbi:MAG: radical SAM protein [Defluviitaleaceae bacterium]|nr:radical SAM protein [Defluviitaleaceae bacterium]MCL2239887.1 radical SAM protein [Defluviitaleaceae bacterium]